MITNVHQQWNFHGLHKQVGGRHGIFHFGFEVGEILDSVVDWAPASGV
jgi:hypothetical protein